MSVKTVLVTGVYGLIAGDIYNHLADRPDQYEVRGLARRRHPSVRAPGDRPVEVPQERFHLADLTDYDGLRRAMEGVDVVVQMAADPRGEADWDSILASNIVGPRNVFEAACEAGVKRVVFASSIMVSWGYQDDEPYSRVFEGRYDELGEDFRPLTHEAPPRPTSYYPASKVWGEALGRYYADQRDLSVICLRIGWVNGEDRPHTHEWARATWCSRRDMVQMAERSIEAADDLRYDVFYCLSDNRYNWVDIDHARQVLGYTPQDSAEERLGLD